MDREPIGYSYLIDSLDLKVVPHYRSSYIVRGRRQELGNIHLYPTNYALKKPSTLAHIEFALKHEGLNLEILEEVFSRLPAKEVEAYVEAQPTGRYARIIWYLYENLVGPLDLPDLNKGSYVSLLDEEQYYTATPTASKRHRVRNNLLGNFSFCAMIRKTPTLKQFEEKDLASLAKEVIKDYDPQLISRAMHYLYSKEIMSSYEIERERPNKKRAARFIELLKHDLDGLSKESLVRLQQAIVDPRFASDDYRDFQNYIGEELGPDRQTIHYVPPKPEDVTRLMEGLLQTEVSTVAAAAAIAFGFVFIHPFEDGNGRIHRFLIHHFLAKMGFTPPGVIFPISAVMLRERQQYDEILESFSKPLLPLIDYDLSREGAMTVNNDTRKHYWAIDYTRMAEYLFECIEKTIEYDFKEELDYLVSYDAAKREIQEIVDMPDQKIDLLIKCIRQNTGKLSARKRESEFSMLTDKEVSALEKIVKTQPAFGLQGPEH